MVCRVLVDLPARRGWSRRLGHHRGAAAQHWELWMASIANLIRGTDGEYFDLFERAGANVSRAGELLDHLLAGFPDSRGLAHDIRDCERDGDQITHELMGLLNRTFVTPIDLITSRK